VRITAMTASSQRLSLHGSVGALAVEVVAAAFRRAAFSSYRRTKSAGLKAAATKPSRARYAWIRLSAPSCAVTPGSGCCGWRSGSILETGKRLLEQTLPASLRRAQLARRAPLQRIDAVAQRLCLDQVVADGETNQVAEAAEIHFAHGVVAMAFHRACGDADHRGSFLVAFSAGEQLHYFQLASR
jgi:hypothetical protein